MKLKFTNSLFFLLILSLGLAAVLFALHNRSVPSFNPGDKYTVVLDAGHGSPDGGAVGPGGTLEKDINLAVVLKLQEVLESRGAAVVLTRPGDSGIYDDDADTIHDKKVSDMNNRLNIINKSKADIFISIHMNAFSDKSSNGLHVFYSRNHPEAEPIAEAVQQRISELTGAAAHTVKTASSTLFLMKNPIPPALLIECGFITNAEEEKLLASEEYQAKIAYAIADALDDYARYSSNN